MKKSKKRPKPETPSRRLSTTPWIVLLFTSLVIACLCVVLDVPLEMFVLGTVHEDRTDVVIGRALNYIVNGAMCVTFMSVAGWIVTARANRR